MDENNSLPVEEAVEQKVVVSAQQASEMRFVLDKYRSEMSKFKNLVENFSGTVEQLKNAWLNASRSPLEQNLEFGDGEKPLFDAFEELNAAKLVLMVYSLEMDGNLKILTDSGGLLNMEGKVDGKQES